MNTEQVIKTIKNLPDDACLWYERGPTSIGIHADKLKLLADVTEMLEDARIIYFSHGSIAFAGQIGKWYVRSDEFIESHKIPYFDSAFDAYSAMEWISEEGRRRCLVDGVVRSYYEMMEAYEASVS